MAAIVVGKERLFGPSQASPNGLDCKLEQTVNIKKNGAVWIRKFIRTEGGDGTDRVKTALRVAKAVYDKQKPDLVQVSVLDQKGPTMRSDMRGRAIAAQVVFIPDVSKLPEDTNAKTYSAYYYDGAPSGEGIFYGLRIDLPLEDTQHLASGLQDFTDCSDPAAEIAPADEHGSAAKGHGKSDGGHGEGGGHGEATPDASEHGKDAPEAAHGESHEGQPSASDGHAGTDDPQLLTSTPEPESTSIFSFAYIKSLIFGKGSTTAVAAEPAGHGEAASEKAEEPAKPEH